MFYSILFGRAENRPGRESDQAPEFFGDLNLDQIVDAITRGKQEYNLKPFFHAPLRGVRAIEYRQEVFRDLENPILFEHIQSFAQQMRTMREQLDQAAKLYYLYQKESWFLDAVEVYCAAVNTLAHDLAPVDLHSRGLLAFREYLTNYANSDAFKKLLAETKQLKAALSSVKYCVQIKDNRVQVRKYQAEPDYSKEVEATFAKFQQGAVRDYRVKFSDGVDLNHVEAQILALVAKLYPDVFLSLDTFYSKNRDYLDGTIGAFDREVQFYIAYLEYIALLKRTGLKFCYPRLSDQDKDIYDDDGFDAALAYKLMNQNASVVCNDFYLKGKERILVVSGPNQGGKTTFARTFGQLHYLASLGCPVPGSRAQLYLFDQLLTHFEREEHVENLRGKLEDDLVRIHDILQRATPRSIIILNEIFTSTTFQDARFLSQAVLEKIIELDLVCVCVTFIDELATLSEKTVSMVSTVVPENPAVRTYKIIRKPADGLAYAVAIADKYHLTSHWLKERIPA